MLCSAVNRPAWFPPTIHPRAARGQHGAYKRVSVHPTRRGGGWRKVRDTRHPLFTRRTLVRVIRARYVDAITSGLSRERRKTREDHVNRRRRRGSLESPVELELKPERKVSKWCARITNSLRKLRSYSREVATRGIYISVVAT